MCWKEPGNHPRHGARAQGAAGRGGPAPGQPLADRSGYPEGADRPAPRLVVYLPVWRGLCAVLERRSEVSLAVPPRPTGAAGPRQ